MILCLLRLSPPLPWFLTYLAHHELESKFIIISIIIIIIIIITISVIVVIVVVVVIDIIVIIMIDIIIVVAMVQDVLSRVHATEDDSMPSHVHQRRVQALPGEV